MPPIDIAQQTIWQLDVCNACRYCEGYCAVFPALEKRRNFTSSDVIYLANLCHDCRACFYACMYAPPHEFGVNIPQALAEVRERTYAQYALPRVVSNLARRHGLLLALATVVGLVVYGGVALAAGRPGSLTSAVSGPGAFYSVIPYVAMMAPFLALTAYVVGVLVLGAFAFARDTGARWDWGAMAGATRDALVLRYLQGGNADACYYPTEKTSRARLVLHMLVFYGFLSALAATIVAFIQQDVFGQLPPYPLLSGPVVLGSIGGVAMIIGATGLLVLKGRSDRGPADPGTLTLDWLFLVSLDVVAISGMLLLMLRETPAMGVLLVVHLATVAALYVSAPYGKFAHVVYRYAALVQNRLESR